MKSLAGVLIAVLLIGGCAGASTTTYDSADVGRTIETASGKVVASRSVKVKGGTSAAGPVAGGALEAPPAVWHSNPGGPRLSAPSWVPVSATWPSSR